MLGSNRSSSGEQGISIAPFAFACPVFPLRRPTPLGDEYTYRRPPSEDPSSSPSPPPSALDCATLLVLTFSPLLELAAPPATPSILVSTSLNISQPLGADITHSPFEGASLRGVIARALPFDSLPLTTWALSI
ncbi:hypothetical protein FB107DRAFT_280348 [Schizophyllum commune]